jgi:hypothetical protein
MKGSPLDEDTEPVIPGSKLFFAAYPNEWADNFGRPFYIHENLDPSLVLESDPLWQVSENEKLFSKFELNVTPPEELLGGIQEIIKEKKQEASNGTS